MNLHTHTYINMHRHICIICVYISHTPIYKQISGKQLTVKWLELCVELNSQFIKRIKIVTQAPCKRFVIVIF